MEKITEQIVKGKKKITYCIGSIICPFGSDPQYIDEGNNYCFDTGCRDYNYTFDPNDESYNRFMAVKILEQEPDDSDNSAGILF